MARTYLNWLLLVIGCAAVLAVLWPREGVADAERTALAEDRVIITYWDRHSGHEHELRKELIEEFNRSQEEIYVRVLPIGARFEKLLTAIASGAPPDVCSLASSTLTMLAPQGCFMPLTDWMNSIPHLREEKFFPHVWRSACYGKDIYGVPTTTDVYCLLWNKSLFRRAGLDPEKPPRTLKELEEYCAKLTKYSEDGSRIEQVGFMPWLPWDLSVLWMGMFNASFWDERTGRITMANDPGTLAALDWFQSFIAPADAAKRAPHAVDANLAQAFQNSGGDYQSANNRFYAGSVAMITEGEWQSTFIPKYKPDLDWGVAPVPQPEGAKPRCYSPDCVLDAIPAGCRHPEEARTFLRWFHTPRANGGPSPASDYCYAIHNIPVRPEDTFQARFEQDPKFRVFLDELRTKPAVCNPTTPASALFTDTLAREAEQVRRRIKTPKEAATTVEDVVNREQESIEKLIERNKQSESN